jgi:hypothetical protein
MPVELVDVELASTLVALGFQGDRTRYVEARSRALPRYHAEPEFRALCFAVARGLGVELLEVTQGGDVVLAADAGTPFTPGVEILLPSFVQADERRRQLAVLALLGVVAEVCPTEDSVTDVDEAIEVHASAVRQLLITRAEAIAREPVVELVGRQQELRRAFEVVREVQPSAPTKSGRESVLGLEGTVTSVLRHLAEHGLLREVRDGERVLYRPTDRFAPHVRYLIAHEAIDDVIEGLRQARADRPAPTAKES